MFHVFFGFEINLSQTKAKINEMKLRLLADAEKISQIIQKYKVNLLELKT